MNPNALNLATQVLDIMDGLPSTDPLSLSNTPIIASNLLPDPGNSKSVDLPPIYGEKVDANVKLLIYLS